MELKIAYYGNPILRKKALPVEEINLFIEDLVKEMIVMMDKKDGIGIAAPQVHHSLALFITRVPIEKGNDEWDPGEVRVFINPKILEYSQEEDSFSEGCLSIPKLYGEVFRPIKIKVEATDLSGHRFIEEFSNLAARVILHENDHINGVLFIDRLSKNERELLEPNLKKIEAKFKEN